MRKVCVILPAHPFTAVQEEAEEEEKETFILPTLWKFALLQQKYNKKE